MPRAPFALLVAALALAPASAAAQPGGLEAARPLAEKGIELYHQGRAAEALEQLEQAEAAFSAPVHQVYMARAHAKLGHLVEAQRHYQNVLADRPKPGENEALVSIREAARRESDALRPRIPTLRVTIAGSRQGARATIDERPVRVAELERGVALDPGEHTVEVVSRRGDARRRTVKLGEGASERIEIALDASEEPTSPGAETGSHEAREDGEQRQDRDPPGAETAAPSRAPAVLAFGVGVAGLGVGAITGIMTLSKASDLKARCRDDGHCPKDEAPRGDEVAALAAVSTVGFVVGAIGVGTGVLLLSIQSAPKKGASAPVRVVVGPGAVTASGSF